MEQPLKMTEDILLRKGKQKTESTFYESEELLPGLFGDYISKFNNGYDNLEHYPLESYVTSRPLFLQQCPLSQGFHDSNSLSCSLGKNENYSPMSGNSSTSDFHSSGASDENLYFGNAEILNHITLERDYKDAEEELLLEDIVYDSSTSDFEMEDSHWKELVKEFDLVKDSDQNERLSSSHFTDVKKDFALNFDPTSNGEQQYINSEQKHHLSADNNLPGAHLLETANPNYIVSSPNIHPCQSHADEDLFEFISKSPVCHTECRDIAPHDSLCADVFNRHEKVSSQNADMLLLRNHLKRRRPSDYGGCKSCEDDLLLSNDLDNIPQRSHLKRKFSFCKGFESTQCTRSESRAISSLNFDSSNTGKMQAMRAFNIRADDFPGTLSVRNISAICSNGSAQACSYDSFCLNAVLPQMPLSLPSVPAEYQLVQTFMHQSVPAMNSTVQQQLTQMNMSNPSLVTDKQKNTVSIFHKISQSLADKQTCTTVMEKRNGNISPSNAESDLSRELCCPAVYTIPFENLTTTDAFQELSCQSPDPGWVHSCFLVSSPLLSEPKFEHKQGEVLNMICGPASSDISKINCQSSPSLLTSFPFSASFGERSSAMGSIKPPHLVQNCPVSPEVLFLSQLPRTTECKKPSSLKVSTDCARNAFTSAVEQNTSPSLMPVLLPHAFVDAPTVHARSELTDLVDGVFPPNAVITSETQIPQLYNRSSLMCAEKVSFTSEILPKSLPGLSTSPVAMPTLAYNRQSSFNGFPMSAASPPLKTMENNFHDRSKRNQLKVCSAEAAVSEFTGESISIGCSEKTCSLVSTGLQSCATLLSPGCSNVQFSGRNFAQSQQRVTFVDSKSSGVAQLQEQSSLFCASEVIESAEDNSWNSTDYEVCSNLNCDAKMTGPSSVLVSQDSSRHCDSTSESERKAATCGHYNEIDLRESDDAALLENLKSLQNEVSQPEQTNIYRDGQMICLHLFLDVPMSVRPGESQIDNSRILYLNKGQYYRLSMGCSSFNQFSSGTAFKSVAMVLFLEGDSSDDQLGSWRTWRNRQQSYKQRILDVDLKDSYGVYLDSMEEIAYNATSFRWNVDQPVRVNISVNCLSTDFTNRKGVKGRPLLIQVDTYKYDEPRLPIHRAYCKIKVFCEKGAERKVRDEERKKEANKAIMKMDDNETNCHKANPGNKDGSEVTRSFSNFIPMQDLSRIPVLFRPDDSLGLTQITQSKSYLPTAKCTNLGNGRFEKQIHSREDSIETSQRLHPDKVITSRECQKVLLYVRRCHDEAFTSLMLQTPTVPALIDALQEKCNIETQEIQTVFKKSKNGILVKLDDESLRQYSNESTFIIDVEGVTSTEEDTVVSYNIILTEIDVDVH